MKFLPYPFFFITFLHASSTDLQEALGFTALRPAFCDSFTISYTFFASVETEPRPKVRVASETYPLYLKVRSTTIMSQFANFLFVTCACGSAPFGPPAMISGLRVDLYPVANMSRSIANDIKMA